MASRLLYNLFRNVTVLRRFKLANSVQKHYLCKKNYKFLFLFISRLLETPAEPRRSEIRSNRKSSETSKNSSKKVRPKNRSEKKLEKCCRQKFQTFWIVLTRVRILLKNLNSIFNMHKLYKCFLFEIFQYNLFHFVIM